MFYLLLEFKMPNFKMLLILWIIYKHGEFIGIYNCVEDKKKYYINTEELLSTTCVRLRSTKNLGLWLLEGISVVEEIVVCF